MLETERDELYESGLIELLRVCPARNRRMIPSVHIAREFKQEIDETNRIFFGQGLKHIRKLADLIIDTSEFTVHTLRQQIIQKFSGFDQGVPMKVEVVSFGHKYGTPRGLDLMLDVRHLPNPYFQKELKHLHGEDEEIIRYLNKQPEVGETIERFNDLLGYLLPRYQREGKSYLTIGIGCTGGRHRSVMVANSVRDGLAQQGFDASVTHRDLQK